MAQIRQEPLFSFREFGLLLLFCFLIGGFLSIVREDNLVKNLLFAESVGICIYTAIKIALWIRSAHKDDLPSYLIGIPVGGSIGIGIGALLTDTRLDSLFRQDRDELVFILLATIVFGVVISYFFYSRSKLAGKETLLRE